MKKALILVFTSIVILCFVACAGNSKKSDMPAEKEITVTREGEKEVFTGTLAVSNTFGYAIYLLPDYELRESGENDFIAPKPESGLLPEINILIYEADPNEAIPEDEFGKTPLAEYHRFSVGDKTLEAKLSYPSEAAEGGAVLLHAMADTICKAE